MRDENSLNEKSKGKTKEGANELLTTGDLQSHRKMFNLISNTFPEVTVSDLFAFQSYVDDVPLVCNHHKIKGFPQIFNKGNTPLELSYKSKQRGKSQIKQENAFPAENVCECCKL